VQPPPLSIASTTLAEKGASIHVINPSLVLIAGSTIAAGATAVQVLGHQVSVDPSASKIIIDGQAHALQPPNSPTADPANYDPAPSKGSPYAAPIITVAGQAASVLSNGNVMIYGTSLVLNAPAITIAETPILLGDGGLVVGTSTIPLPSSTAAAVAGIVTVAGKSVTVLHNGDVVVAGSTVTPNALIFTVAGNPVSLGSSGLVIGTSTIPLPSLPSTPIATIGGQTFALSQTTNGVVIGSMTLQIGQSAMISGTAVKLGSMELVIGTSTVLLPSIGPSPEPGIGGFILSGINGGLTAPSVTGSASLNQSQTNGTGAAGGTAAFLGVSSRVKVHASDFIMISGTLIVLTLFKNFIC